MENGKDFGGYKKEELLKLLQLAEESVAAVVMNKDVEPPPPQEQKLLENGAAFVTLKKNGELRGCIGHVIARIPLFMCVSEMASAAAMHDSRFSPVSKEELDSLEYEISILTTPTPIEPDDVQVGVHGLIVKKGQYSGLLLPQVPVEWNWTREQFLSYTCQKAGLGLDSWRKPGLEIKAFRAIVFNRDEL